MGLSIDHETCHLPWLTCVGMAEYLPSTLLIRTEDSGMPSSNTSRLAFLTVICLT